MPRVVANKPQPLDPESKKELQQVQSAFGTRLRQLRHDRRMTIEQVAEIAGLHDTYLSSVERGERNISLFNIWRIASSLGLNGADLMSGLPQRQAKSLATSNTPSV